MRIYKKCQALPTCPISGSDPQQVPGHPSSCPSRSPLQVMHDQLIGVLQKAMDPSQPLLQPITPQTLDPQSIAHPTGVHITALLRQLCCSMQVRGALLHAVPGCTCTWHCH